MYPAIKPKKLSGTESLITADGKKICSLIDFWRWAYSDLVGNAERGALAEFIVASALGIQDSERISWDKYDLLTKEGIAIEVKTSGYLQTWEQENLSKLVFGISPTYGWDSKTNKYDEIKKRQSDIYVFCVHKHTEQSTANPLLISQWDFYLMPTKLLDEKFREQKSATLSSLIKAGALKCDYEELNIKIKELAHSIDIDHE